MRRVFPVLSNLGVANGITTLGAVFGFLGILSASNGNLRVAGTCLLGAILCDRLDGPVAHWLGEKSSFGGHLDSLSDGLTLCLLPAFLGYRIGLESAGAITILCMYVLAGLWRLADFNLTGIGVREGRTFFRGIPTTVAASWLLVVLSAEVHVSSALTRGVLLTAYAACALLMSSRIQYPKEGAATKILYVAVPMATALLWLPASH